MADLDVGLIELASTTFRFPLKEEQKNILTHLLRKEHVFAILPTGYGKSACFGLFGGLMDKVNEYTHF